MDKISIERIQTQHPSIRSKAENRRPNGTFRIEPLHQVHDALIGQFDAEDLEWARVKIREYFNNPIKIAGTELVIPFEGGYGRNWLDTKTNKL